MASLDRVVDDEASTELGQLLASETPSPDELAEFHDREQTIRSTVATLPSTARAVIDLRFGLDGDAEPLPLSTTAARLGLSTATVRKIERQALAELAARRPARRVRRRRLSRRPRPCGSMVWRRSARVSGVTSAADRRLEMTALVILLLILALFGGLGFAIHLLWFMLVVALILWAIGFLIGGAEAGLASGRRRRMWYGRW